MAERAVGHGGDDSDDERRDQLEDLLDSVDERHPLGAPSTPPIAPPSEPPASESSSTASRIDIPSMLELLEVLRSLDSRLQTVERQIRAAAPVAVELPPALRGLDARVTEVHEAMRALQETPPPEPPEPSPMPPQVDHTAELQGIQAQLEELPRQLADAVPAAPEPAPPVDPTDDLRHLQALVEGLRDRLTLAEVAPTRSAPRPPPPPPPPPPAREPLVIPDHGPALDEIRTRIDALTAEIADAVAARLPDPPDPPEPPEPPVDPTADLHHVQALLEGLRDRLTIATEADDERRRTERDELAARIDDLPRQLADVIPAPPEPLPPPEPPVIPDHGPALDELRTRIDALTAEIADAVAARLPDPVEPVEPVDPSADLRHLHGLVEGLRDRLTVAGEQAEAATAAWRTELSQLAPDVAAAVAEVQPPPIDHSASILQLQGSIEALRIDLLALPPDLAATVTERVPIPVDPTPEMERLHEAITFLRDHLDAAMTSRDPAPLLREIQEGVRQAADGAPRLGDLSEQLAAASAAADARSAAHEHQLRDLASVLAMCLDDVHRLRRAVDSSTQPDTDIAPTVDRVQELLGDVQRSSEELARRHVEDIDRIERTLAAVITAVLEGKDTTKGFDARSQDVAEHLAVLRSELEAQRSTLVELGEAFTRISKRE